MTPVSNRVVRLDTSSLLPAECHFNPSLAWWEGSLSMVYRRVTPEQGVDVVEWPRQLALCRLNEQLQPEPGTQIDLSARIEDAPGARRWHADARFFLRRDTPWLYFHDNHDLFMMALNPNDVPDSLRPRPVALVGRARRERERNWGFFDDGQLKAIYTIDPHVVLQVSETATTFEARDLHESRPEIPWAPDRWGEPHGGTAPVRVGDCWFSFFQSSALVRPGSEQKLYVVGFYGFDAAPPHPIRYMTGRPLLEGRELEGQKSFWNDYAVAYPSGAVYRDGTWLLALGIHDRAIGFVRLAHDELLASCEKF